MVQAGSAPSLRIGLVCEGDASHSETAFSGTAKRIFESLRAQGHTVVPIDASLPRWRRAIVAAGSFALDRKAWRSRFRYGSLGAHHRAACAIKSLGDRPVDIILQIGATYEPPAIGQVPYALYCDWNMALNLCGSEGSLGKSLALPRSEMEAIARKHADLYRRASAVFTISERLKRSFEELYGLAPDKVHTAYAGPNFDMSLIEAALQKPKRSASPNVLFVAKEFHRKGGETVAAAFAQLNRRIPQARLVYAGSKELPAELAALNNVEHLGLLDKANASQLQRLLDAFRQADILVLPSRHDPFPTVIREAMFFGVPCIASDIWAMPEMIEDGKTGFLVPVDDPEALATQMMLLLADDQRRADMGRAARARALALFSWDSVGKALSDGLRSVVHNAPHKRGNMEREQFIAAK